MSPLPESTAGPPAETAAAPAADPPVPRHLHAVHHSEETIEAEVKNTEVENTAPVAETDTGHTATSGTGGGAWLRAAFTPGSGLYTDRQPSVAETVRRAKRGGQLADHGPLRVMAVGHGYFAAVNKAVCQTWIWVVDHPARLVVAGVLLTLAISFPTTRHLLGLLLTPVVWVQQALI